MDILEQPPFCNKRSRMGILCKVRIRDPYRLDEIDEAGYGDVLAPMLLDVDWETLAGVYAVESSVPLEEYYTNSTRGFEPTYEEYKEAVMKAVIDIDDYEPLENGDSLLYLDSTGGWHARACRFVDRTANLPVISIDTNPEVKLAIVETVRKEPRAGKP